MSEELSGEELYDLCAVDRTLFGKTFFPNTCRQKTPLMHLKMDSSLDSTEKRLVSFEVFRGGAKTTRFRLFAAHRISYAISRTILFVGKSEGHASRSVQWIAKNVRENTKWATFFNLKVGDKDSQTELQIINEAADVVITIIAIGITGSTRGINVDDYRPDLIVVDDPCDEENTATPEQRAKIEDLFFGALLKSLAAPGDAPRAKMVLAQTPLIEFDLISQAKTDPRFIHETFGCFDEEGNSRWEEMFPTEDLLKDKQAHIDKNQLSLWLREMECVVVNRENAAFKVEWLRYYEYLPEGGVNYLGIDPTPPPKQSSTVVTADKKKKQKLDDAVVMVVKLYKGKYYLCDYYACKSPDPGEFIAKIFEMCLRWKVFMVSCETTLFQRVLAWLFRKEMERRRKWFTIFEVEEKRSKPIRIQQKISDHASNGLLHVHRSQSDFIQQYITYLPAVANQSDDYLDAYDIATAAVNSALEDLSILDGEYEVINEDDIPSQIEWRGAP